MSKFDAHLNEEAAVDKSTVVDNSKPWKERIVEWMVDQDDAKQKFTAILEATDDKYDPDSDNKKFRYENRKHCLDSQLTYIRQDYDIRTRVDGESVILLGIERGDKLVPFTNAVEYL